MRHCNQIEFLKRIARMCSFKGRMLFIALVFLMALMPVSKSFAENNAQVQSEAGAGYGRIVFTFDTLPDYKLEILEGVLVLKFNEVVNVDIEELADKLAEYIVVARVDPDKTGVRFALAQEVKVNKIEAAEKLFIDLLPVKWKGLPPSLPEEVIAELALRAEEASISAREKILQRELKLEKNQLIVRYGELPTFTRLFFDWKLNVETKMERNGKVVTLRFDHYAQPIIKDLKTTPPKFLKKIDYKVTRTELLVNLTLEANTDVRGFQEGMGFVVDLSNGQGGQIKRLSETISDSEIAAMGGLLPDDEEEKQGVAAPNSERNGIKFLAPSNDADEISDEQAAATALPEVEAKALPDEAEPKALPETTESKVLPEEVANGNLPPEIEPSNLVETEQPAKDLTSGAITAEQDVRIALNRVVQDGELDAINTELPIFLDDTSLSNNLEDDNDVVEAKKNYIPVETEAEKVRINVERSNREYKVRFPFKQDVAVAAFERDQLFWLIFEKKIDFDISELENAAPELIKVHDVRVIDNSTTLRLKLDKRLLTDIGSSNSDWLLSIGELVLMDTKVLKLERKYKQDGHAIVQVNLSNLGKVHWFIDEKIGDKIAVVTAMGPARGVLKTHNFVEFTALPTVHGLAFSAVADDINVAANFDQVVVSSREGLSLTVGQNYTNQLELFSNGEIKRPSAIAFRDLEKDAPEFMSKRHELDRLIIESEDEKEQSIYRLEMVEFLLSYQLGNEALGMLEFERIKSPTSASSARFKSLEGAAYTIAGKYKKAINVLSAVAIRNNRTATMFRAYAFSKIGSHQEALKEFDSSLAMLAQLPAKMEAEFLIAAIESALALPKLNIAQKHLIMLRNVMETDAQRARYWLLMARFSQMNDETKEALLRYKAAVEFDIRPVSAEANGQITMLKYKDGIIDIDEAIDQLNSNVVMWRGDNIEQVNTLNLGKLYMDKGEYRNGLSLLKTAASKLKSNDTGMGRDTAKYMADVFETLYLGNKANEMLPFKALSLFYDFKELTPIGRKGDEMIRNLADRLIDVDLLDQAIELLDHQVYKRLNGIAKADVASKLAMVQLLNYQPEAAIQTIAKSRVANMPMHIARKRDLLEARALVEIGRIQSAITRLEGYEGKDISIIKSEAYWRGNYWQKAGEEFETMVLNRWQDDKPLLDNERHLLLRSAIAYKMANDNLSLGRLRKQYMRKMENTSHAGSFNLVVDEAETNAGEFRKLAREIAEIDMLKEFISDYRENEAKDIRDRDNSFSNQAS